MILERLRLAAFRCHRRANVSFAPGVTVLVGPNGAGKTSVLEAAHFLFRGASPRTATPRDLVTRGESVLRVEGDLRDSAGRHITAAVGWSVSGERRLTAAGSPLASVARWEGVMPVRMFLPDDLRLVKGSPRRRRAYMDQLAPLVDPAYCEALARYDEALQQRNALLRQGVVGADHMPWEALLAREGRRLVSSRARLLAALAPPYAQAHGRLAPAPTDPVGLTYRTNAADLDEEAYRERLAEQRVADRRRTFTHVGPHRDDIRLTLGGRDLREFGSQGEQRTALLALLVAERERARGEGGDPPLLLLDDVMSELDPTRRRALMRILLAGGQSIITTTDLHYFTSEELAMIEVVRLREDVDPPDMAPRGFTARRDQEEGGAR